ncbi:MAG: hypothetical protein VKK04_16725 [Synechococcales bacterium]|nr:hypothetical protein [Synechococcales bacterium]
MGAIFKSNVEITYFLWLKLRFIHEQLFYFTVLTPKEMAIAFHATWFDSGFSPPYLKNNGCSCFLTHGQRFHGTLLQGCKDCGVRLWRVFKGAQAMEKLIFLDA